MFHANTQRLIDYWLARKGAAPAPARAAIDPAALPALLPQLFMLGRARPGHYVFRLAGGLVDELHGGRLAGSDALGLWTVAHRPPLQLALEASLRAPEPLVITAEGRAAHRQPLALEITFAPLAGADGDINRLLGLYQPITPVAALLGQALEALAMRSIATARFPNGSPRLRLAAVDGRQIA